jgi:4,4'-diaponeurosporenoate glycosyltransferase
MNLLFYAFLIFCWALGFFFLWRIPLLIKDDGLHLDPNSVSIIIPARNEAGNIARLLGSLEDQSLHPGEIIVVDDHSEDGTAAVAEKSGCTLIRSKGIPAGWLGKPWACWQGAQRAGGEFLLFLDADVFLTSDGIAKIMATFSEDKDLISIQPYHRMEKPYERLSAIFNMITMAGMNAFTAFGSKLKPAGAFGPSLMCRREDYFKLGGHERVHGEILENMALGRVFIKEGRRVSCYGGKGSLQFRMYPEGLRSLVQGFGKGFGIGANAISIVSLFMIVCWVFGGVSLTRHLIQSVVVGNETGLLLFLALDVMYVGQIHWMLSRIGNFGFSTAVVYQIPLLFFVLVFFLSIAQTFVFRRSRWKGRTVKPRKMT